MDLERLTAVLMKQGGVRQIEMQIAAIDQAQRAVASGHATWTSLAPQFVERGHDFGEAVAHFHVAQDAELRGQPESALPSYTIADRWFRERVSEFPDDQDRANLKAEIDPITQFMIRALALGAESVDDRQRLAELLDSLRQASVSGSRGGASSESLVSLESPDGSLARLFEQRRAAFVWIHEIERAKEVIVFTARPGKPSTVSSLKDRDLASFFLAIDFINGILEGEQFSVVLGQQLSGVGDYRGTPLAKEMQLIMSGAFRAFPPEFRDLLTSDEVDTIFVSPCGDTLSFPFELLPVPGTDVELEFVGLKKVFSRVFGLAGVSELMSRGSEIQRARTILIADPETRDPRLLELKDGRAWAKELKRKLEEAGQNLEAEYGSKATRNWAVPRLKTPDLGAFVFIGHSEFGVLKLAGGDLRGEDFAHFEGSGPCFHHYDGCQPGKAEHRGGGAFDGLVCAAFGNHASAVLAGFHKLYDKPAVEFSRVLYESMLDRGSTLREALLEARLAIHQNWGGNALLWANSIVWGNPYFRFQNGLCSGPRTNSGASEVDK